MKRLEDIRCEFAEICSYYRIDHITCEKDGGGHYCGEWIYQRDMKVSVLTVTYNHENSIGKCIESILSQNYKNWEQIIVDDGSTDRTADIAESYNDRRIKVFREKNRGIKRLDETYNVGLSHASGQFLAVLEGDDFSMPWRLSTQVKSLINSDNVLSYGKCLVAVNGKIVSLRPRNIKFHNRLKNKMAALAFAIYGDFIMSQTVMLKMSVLRALGGFKHGTYYVDFPTWSKLLNYGKFVFVDSILGCWCLHGDNATIRLANYSDQFNERIRFLFSTFPSVMIGRNKGVGNIFDSLLSGDI